MAKEKWHTWHRCEPWNARKLPCPYTVLKGLEEREEEPQDEPQYISRQDPLISREQWADWRARAEPVRAGVRAVTKSDALVGRISELLAIRNQGFIDVRAKPSPETYYEMFGVRSFPQTAEFGFAREAFAQTVPYLPGYGSYSKPGAGGPGRSVTRAWKPGMGITKVESLAARGVRLKLANKQLIQESMLKRYGGDPHDIGWRRIHGIRRFGRSGPFGGAGRYGGGGYIGNRSGVW